MTHRSTKHPFARTALCFALSLAISAPVLAAGPNMSADADNQTHVHGDGKKALDCNFQMLRIVAGDKIVDRPVPELIAYPPSEYANPSARRIVARDQPVYPVSMLLDSHPDASKVVFSSCDDDKQLSVQAADIRQDPKRYLLTLNRANRAKLVEFSETPNARPVYATVAKNIISISVKP